MIVERIQVAGEFGLRKNTDLAKFTHSKGMVPDNMKKSDFLVLPKKNVAVECTNYKNQQHEPRVK